MTKKELKQLQNAMHSFALRVLRGEGTPQEVASLPAILGYLYNTKPSDAADGFR